MPDAEIKNCAPPGGRENSAAGPRLKDEPPAAPRDETAKYPARLSRDKQAVFILMASRLKKLEQKTQAIFEEIKTGLADQFEDIKTCLADQIKDIKTSLAEKFKGLEDKATATFNNLDKNLSKKLTINSQAWMNF